MSVIVYVRALRQNTAETPCMYLQVMTDRVKFVLLSRGLVGVAPPDGGHGRTSSRLHGELGVSFVHKLHSSKPVQDT